MEAKHTAGPWTLKQAPCGYIYAVCNEQNDAIRIETTNPETAAFIVRACNAHDELVKALKAFLALDPTFTSTCDAHLGELVLAQDPMAIAVSMARMALAKAGAA